MGITLKKLFLKKFFLRPAKNSGENGRATGGEGAISKKNAKNSTKTFVFGPGGRKKRKAPSYLKITKCKINEKTYGIKWGHGVLSPPRLAAGGGMGIPKKGGKN